MTHIVRVGVDLSKSVLQVHAIDGSGKVLANRAFSQDRFFEWCVVAMEASSGVHHIERRLTNFGLQVKIIAAQFVVPYRIQGKTGKNDANDAAAICEAASRPHIHDVPLKSAQQQAVTSLHKIREGLKEERTACINRIRGLLYEFGVMRSRAPRNLRSCLADIIEDASNELPTLARLVIQRAYQHWLELEEHLAWCDDQIIAYHKSDEQVRRAAELIGVGTITASAVVASVGDFRQFKSGAQFGAWFGLTPKQNSSRGKTNLGKITKRGNCYLRNLIVVTAKAAVFTCEKRSNPTSVWVRKLRDRIGWQKATVALANKNARILCMGDARPRSEV
ncbi:Transposase [Candidatus Burkholderia brachyanthoides]|nr:Transposase [Candidatus Burkholderia brachyanthoides]